MKDQPMNTIEKAAARLATLKPESVPVREEEVQDSIQEQSIDASGPSLSLEVSAVEVNQDVEVEEIVAQPVHPTPIVTRARQMCEFDLALVSERGYLTPTDTRSQLAHEMRRIKRPLLLNIRKGQQSGSKGAPSNLILVTSALPGEGKTFISVNLAMSLSAEPDRTVVLVDGDVPKGDISRQLGVEPERGLADLLSESVADPEEAILRTNVDRLSLLLAGKQHEHIDELFASNLMGEITHRLAAYDPNRVVLFDAPPLLATTEAAVLASHMGQVLVIVEANRTPQDAVVQALAQLEDCPNVSILLNKTSRREASTYGYGYGGSYPNRYEQREA